MRRTNGIGRFGRLVTFVAFAGSASLASAQIAHLDLDLTWGYELKSPTVHSGHYSLDFGGEEVWPIMVVNGVAGGTATDLGFTLVPSSVNAPSADLWFSSATSGQPLQIGQYDLAERAPFQTAGHPGFAFGFGGIGDNDISGSFAITTLRYGANGKLEEFAATFDALGDRADHFKGSLYYSAATVPEVGTGIMSSMGLSVFVGLRLVRRRQRLKK